METTLTPTPRGRRMETALTAAYFTVSLAEIIAEYFKNIAVIYTVKPMILILLAFLYLKTCKKANHVYLFALLFKLAGQFVLRLAAFRGYLCGRAALCGLSHRDDLPGHPRREAAPAFAGAHRVHPVPFHLPVFGKPDFDAIGRGLSIFVAQCVMISLLGGLSVGHFMFRSSTAATLLLSSTLFFVVTQFIFVIRLYYINVNIFHRWRWPSSSSRITCSTNSWC